MLERNSSSKVVCLGMCAVLAMSPVKMVFSQDKQGEDLEKVVENLKQIGLAESSANALISNLESVQSSLSAIEKENSELRAMTNGLGQALGIVTSSIADTASTLNNMQQNIKNAELKAQEFASKLNEKEAKELYEGALENGRAALNEMWEGRENLSREEFEQLKTKYTAEFNKLKDDLQKKRAKIESAISECEKTQIVDILQYVDSAIKAGESSFALPDCAKNAKDIISDYRSGNMVAEQMQSQAMNMAMMLLSTGNPYAAALMFALAILSGELGGGGGNGGSDGGTEGDGVDGSSNGGGEDGNNNGEAPAGTSKGPGSSTDGGEFGDDVDGPCKARFKNGMFIISDKANNSNRFTIQWDELIFGKGIPQLSGPRDPKIKSIKCNLENKALGMVVNSEGGEVCVHLIDSDGKVEDGVPVKDQALAVQIGDTNYCE